MKEREELELILKLIGKYKLPLSPILEYAVKEKMEEYSDMDVPSSDVVAESNSLTGTLESLAMVNDNEEPSDYTTEQSSDSMRVQSTEDRRGKINKIETCTFEKDDFTIRNTLSRCFIINKHGEKVFSATGRLIYINGEMYHLNISAECFTLKSMIYKGGLWKNGENKIIAFPDTELFHIMDFSLDYAYEIEDIVDSTVFENCRLKVEGSWFYYNGILILDYSD